MAAEQGTELLAIAGDRSICIRPGDSEKGWGVGGFSYLIDLQRFWNLGLVVDLAQDDTEGHPILDCLGSALAMRPLAQTVQDQKRRDSGSGR